MRSIGLFFFVIVYLSVGCARTNSSGSITIDETKQSEDIFQLIEIDSVWSGHPVGFSLVTSGNRQYIAYYNANRNMVVGQRNLDDERFELHVMPATYRETHNGTSTVLGWDSHNSVTLAVDKQGFIHLSGNMHVHPLTYFKSSETHNIASLQQVMSMTGTEEDKVTYPSFMTDRNGNLIFHYRDGVSGQGNEIYNIYDAEVKTWKRLLDVPLTDGKGQMNAYQSQPLLMDDNWYHLYWVWRDTPDCATNHDLSYMKSPDLINWYNAYNEPVELPATIDNKSLIVDPIPPGGGIINLAAKLCLDENHKPVFIYHKYDEQGFLQLYTAQLKNGKWVYSQITDWDYRWEFSGNGSVIFEVYLKDFKKRADGFYEISYYHKKYGNETLLLDKNFNNVGMVLKPAPFSETMEVEGQFPGLQVRTTGDDGEPAEQNVRYLLKWETLPQNRDQPHPKPWPEPSRLYLYKLKK